MAVDNVQINSSTGVDGNSYTTAISNDKLTNDDFLKLLLEEMKMQDPTSPMDSQKMMDSQLQMSTIEANMNMAESMAALQTAFGNTALASATGLIGKIVEDGSTSTDGIQKSFQVQTVENIDGTMYLNAREMVGKIDTLASVTTDSDGNETEEIAKYNSSTGEIYDSDGNSTGVFVKMDGDRFSFDSDNAITLQDADGNEITDQDTLDKYKYTGYVVSYSDTVTKIEMSDVIKVM